MGIRDLVSNISAVHTLVPATRSTDANGAGIDLRDFQSSAVVIQWGAGGITFDGTNRLDFILQHSDDNSTFTAVAAADVIGLATAPTNGIVASLVTAQAAGGIAECGYVGGRRFLRVVADFGGTHGTGTPTAALVVRGNPNYAPA